MPMKANKNLPLILGIAIPVVMVLAVALSIWIPSLSAHPETDFLYSQTSYASGPYYSSVDYYVAGGKIEKTAYATTNLSPEKVGLPGPFPDQDVRLYVHVTSDNSNREITFADAQKLTLDDSSLSPDGYQIVFGNGGGGFFPFFFSGSDYDSKYIQGHGAKKRLNLAGGSDGRSFKLIGWIMR